MDRGSGWWSCMSTMSDRAVLDGEQEGRHAVDPPPHPGEGRVHHALPACADRARTATGHRRGHDGRPEARAHRGRLQLRASRVRREGATVTSTSRTSSIRTGSGSRSSTTATGSTRTKRPPFEGEELSEGGLGIAIIRTIADEFEIDSKPGSRGSRLRFVKLLS